MVRRYRGVYHSKLSRVTNPPDFLKRVGRMWSKKAPASEGGHYKNKKVA